ncbi:MAG: hypothetical protein S0880_29995 [Actinomycetota bacterium]|nr:hypothetical protein [Actinomycetota bacterium]
MQVLAALFIDGIEMRSVAGPSTRIDLTGVQFSAAAPGPPPFTWAPHMVVLVHCAPDEAPNAILEVTFHLHDEQIARNVQPMQVEPAKFGRFLVRPEVEITELGRIEAQVRIDQGPVTTVPYTLLEPATA